MAHPKLSSKDDVYWPAHDEFSMVPTDPAIRSMQAGCSTSSCIHATAEGCFDNGFRAVVVREAVGDRSPSSHEANLFDVDARYADVVSLDHALDYLVSLRSLGSPT